MDAKYILKDIQKDPQKKTEFEENPQQFITKYAQVDPTKNKTIFITVVIILGAALLMSISGVIWGIKSADETVDNFFIMIASGATGALAGLIGHNTSS